MIDFLEIKTLVITDLDSVKETNSDGVRKRTKCPVGEGSWTSNEAIKGWFQTDDLAQISSKDSKDKIQSFRRICYQVPEPGTQDGSREERSSAG
jgi:hypothetical protein